MKFYHWMKSCVKNKTELLYGSILFKSNVLYD